MSLPATAIYEEKDLLAKVAEGDQIAFRQLFFYWHQALAGYIFRIIESRELTEEIVQDVFLKIWTVRETLTGINNFKHFLLAVSRNKAYDLLRKHLRERELKKAWEKENIRTLPGVDDEIGLARLSIIERAIESLPPRRKEVFLLSRSERLTYREIAVRLDISKESVKTHLKLASMSITGFIRTNLSKIAGGFFFLIVFICGRACGQARPSAVPTLEELASEWMEVSTLRNFPSVMNFSGGLQTTQNITGFQNMTFPPYAQGNTRAYSWNEGLNSPALAEAQKENGECALLINGQPVKAAVSKWLPYEVQRKVSMDGVEFHSFVRLPFEQKGVLLRLVLYNPTAKTRTFDLTMNCYGHVRYYPMDEWQTWGNIRPADSNFSVSAGNDPRTLVVQDKYSFAVSQFSFVTKPDGVGVADGKGAINWRVRMAPGARKVIECVYAIGKNVHETDGLIRKWASDFGAVFELSRAKWEERWEASFVPGNSHFSGHFPTLVTTDARIRRVYYMGALAPLLLCRTDLPLSPRCFVTAGPQWANTLVYFWDTEMWANTWAMLEPVAMRQQLLKWLSMDIHHCYAVDCMSGGGAGPWYAANDWSVFRCVEAYLGVTGDSLFLREMVNGMTVLQRLDEVAEYFRSRPLVKSSLLADYGGPGNLLECSPSYIQGVPSLNAANVYMLEKTAAYYERAGSRGRAEELRAIAGKLLPEVLSLYVSGQGVWDALDRTGKKVPVRHCYDFITVGQALEKYLSPATKSEMYHFVQSELLTKTWMRAMSLKDPAADKSDRPDHGPMGSYDAWPPLTMDVMCRFGDFTRAIQFLRATEAVTRLGPWAQSHEFTGAGSRGFDPIVRVASRGGQDANEGCGAAFVEVIMRSFFGFRPDLSESYPVLLSPNVPRGFSGELKHVSWKKGLYTIVSDEKGVHVILEN